MNLKSILFAGALAGASTSNLQAEEASRVPSVTMTVADSANLILPQGIPVMGNFGVVQDEVDIPLSADVNIFGEFTGVAPTTSFDPVDTAMQDGSIWKAGIGYGSDSNTPRFRVGVTGFNTHLEQEALPNTGILALTKSDYIGAFAEVRQKITDTLDLVLSAEHDEGDTRTQVPQFLLDFQNSYSNTFGTLGVEMREPVNIGPLYITASTRLLLLETHGRGALIGSGAALSGGVTALFPVHKNGSGFFVNVNGLLPLQGMEDAAGVAGKPAGSIMAGFRAKF